MTSFIVPGRPVPLARARIRKGQGGYLEPRSLEYRDRVQKAWMQAGRPTLEIELLSLSARFYRGDKRRLDLDNLLKALLDALKGCLFEDDSQVVRFNDVSLHRSEHERTEVKVWEAWGG